MFIVILIFWPQQRSQLEYKGQTLFFTVIYIEGFVLLHSNPCTCNHLGKYFEHKYVMMLVMLVLHLSPNYLWNSRDKLSKVNSVYRYIQGPYSQTCVNAAIGLNISWCLYLALGIRYTITFFGPKTTTFTHGIQGTNFVLFTIALKASYFCIQIHVRATIWVNISSINMMLVMLVHSLITVLTFVGFY